MQPVSCVVIPDITAVPCCSSDYEILKDKNMNYFYYNLFFKTRNFIDVVKISLFEPQGVVCKENK